MGTEQSVLSQLAQSARNGVRPQRTQAALAEVPRLIQELEALEQELARATQDAEGRLREAARHLVGAGGKRVRPLVTLLACGACGGEVPSSIPLAVAAELTHSATLLHDDVIDDGALRRGKPASRVLWGNAVSVLSGDWLLTRAIELVADHPAKSAALPALLATMRRLVEGEVLQLSLRGTFRASEEEYFEVVAGKTASLFGWCAAAGGWAAGMRGLIPESLMRFGEGIGIAFQLVDDALDYAADPAEFGKRLGADLTEGKATLPLIRACSSRPELRQKVLQLVEGEGPVEQTAREVIELVQSTGSIDATRTVARRYTEEAMEALQQIPDGPHRRALAEAAAMLTERLF